MRNLEQKLIEEFIVVALVCALFLFHLRSAFVAIVSLPLGISMAFIVMHYQGVNANIMSLGGIAIAIGAMVDAAVVMIENAHKHIERWHARASGRDSSRANEQWQVIGDAASEVGPALFFSLLIITLSFIPDVHARSAGRAAVLAARLHQDLRDGGCGGLRRDARSRADGLPDPRPDSRRERATRSIAC